MIGTLQCVVLDCHYPAGLAHFYAALLGGEVDRPDPRWSLDEEWSTVHLPNGQVLGFQRVEDYRPPIWPDPGHPQQLHLDIEVEDVAAVEQRVVELGAEVKDRQQGWTVFVDPAGHPFCLIPRHAA
ncbi:VOC family protein [Kitasatospora sp. CB01950]|uniref:VOC family protein n=1 Tax=Kitasatospora sp. CB01950 TaxID=1703930 RepID=UPI00093A1A81|nr:VOC family protein [Kitasatospora sp. CB01950]OKJ17104.1 glyoxalase [Kitasatospora sp. CB01950]